MDKVSYPTPFTPERLRYITNNTIATKVPFGLSSMTRKIPQIVGSLCSSGCKLCRYIERTVTQRSEDDAEWLVSVYVQYA